MSVSLPSNANIGHLKKQAKQLLKACRNNQLEAKRRFIAHHPAYASGINDCSKIRLQEAQLVVAREYGLGSWAKLLEVLDGGASGDAPDDSGILLITNGAHAIKRLEAANVPGVKVEWLEALHEGPVPQTESRLELRRIRARHFESLGWTSFDGALCGFEKRERALQDSEKYNELQLWFEHDLYDQLQLIELLDCLSELPGWWGKTRLVQFNTHLGRVDLAELSAGSQNLLPVSTQQIALARRAWSAFRQPHPQALAALLAEDTAALPYLKASILRLCQEFPGEGSGLGRTERQILEIVRKSERSPGDLFRDSQALEEAVFMGDSSFYMIVDRLLKSAEPLLSLNGNGELLFPSRVGYTDTFRNQRLNITAMGERVLRGEADRLDGLSSPYWIGGCLIKDRAAPRWDEALRAF